MEIDVINAALEGEGIRVTGARNHEKASERWVQVEFAGPDGDQWWVGPIPYQDQRARLELETDDEIADYLRNIKEHFDPEAVQQWAEAEEAYWDESFPDAEITGGFFKALVSMEWVSRDDFPLNPDGLANPNSQRRIQDIKDKGYTVVFQTGDGTEPSKMILLPLPRRDAHAYETISPKLKTRILRVLGRENAYELSGTYGLLPDHKFPEMRWDAETPRDNQENMTDDEIRAKFQLLDNRRNLQKRESCRHCYQTGERGKLFGVSFFYAGDPQWDEEVPRNGVEAERGCVGCGWYDIRAWRNALNEHLNEG